MSGRSPGAVWRGRAWLANALRVLLLVVLAGAWASVAGAAETRTLTIETAQGPRQFEVELAVAPEERAKGLMFRRRLADDAGMLFDFGREQPISMWMRNTYIPLDMIFAFEDGTIHRIAANTEPFSERTIRSGEPVRYVLEIAGGRAAELGVEPGDRLAGAGIGE